MRNTQKTLTLATHVMLWHLCSDTHQTKSLHQSTEDNCVSLSVVQQRPNNIYSAFTSYWGTLKIWNVGVFQNNMLGNFFYEAPQKLPFLNVKVAGMEDITHKCTRKQTMSYVYSPLLHAVNIPGAGAVTHETFRTPAPPSRESPCVLYLLLKMHKAKLYWDSVYI